MKVVLLSVLTFFLLFSVIVIAKIPYTVEMKSFLATKFQLHVSPACNGSSTYSMYFHSLENSLHRTHSVLLEGGREKVVAADTILLDDVEYEVFKDRLKSAFSFKFGDDIDVTDGERWCIESDMYQTFKACIGTPWYKAEERGYVELIEFRDYLESLFDQTLDEMGLLSNLGC